MDVKVLLCFKRGKSLRLLDIYLETTFIKSLFNGIKVVTVVES